MDLTAWIVSAAVPAAIAALAGAIAIAIGWKLRPAKGDFLSGPTSRFDFLAPLVLGIGWAAAVSAGLLGQRISQGDEGPHWWPEEFWQRGYWIVWGAAIAMGATAKSSWRDLPLRWVLAGLLAIATASLSLAAGDGWEDVLPLHQGWTALLASTCLLGIWSLDRLSATGADRWFPLVVLASLAGPMLVGAATYGALAQWTAAAISATLPIVGLALFGWISSRNAVGIAYPAIAFATVLTAAGRFYSYEDLPWWSYLGMMLVPVAILVVDYPFRRRHNGIRAAVAAITATLVIGVSVWLQSQPGEADDEEWSRVDERLLDCPPDWRHRDPRLTRIDG